MLTILLNMLYEYNNDFHLFNNLYFTATILSLKYISFDKLNCRKIDLRMVQVFNIL